MTKVRIGLIGAIVLLASSPAFAQGLFGSNCGSGCGIGNDINVPTITCNLYDSNSSDPLIPCQTNLASYPANLPATVDPTKFVWKFSTYHLSYGGMSGAWGLNTADRLYVDQNTAPTLNHTVITDHMVPGGGIQNGGSSGYTFYAVACQHAFPCPNTDPTWTTYPGPTCLNGGLACYFRVTPPNPVTVVPMQMELNTIGHQSATQGYPTFVPLLALWKSGSFPGVTSLPAQPVAANTIAHINSNAPNTGNWYVSNGTQWINQSPVVPVWYVTTLTITDGSGNTYICHPDANGNVNPTTRAPQNTCKTSGNVDSGIVVIPQYPNWQQTSSTDYRQIEFDSSTGQYAIAISNVLSPPLNPQSTFVMEVFPSSSSITGNVTVNLGLTLYTDGSHHTPAAGTTPVSVSYPITIKTLNTLSQSTPSSFTTDSNLPTYLGFAAQSVVNMCSNAGASYGLAWWNLSQHTWLWLVASPTTFGEFYTWNYDNSRVMLGAADMLLHKMDGTAWGDWAANTAYGSTYASTAIQPTSGNPNNYVFVAVAPGTSNGTTEPTWATVPIGGTRTDGTVTWFNAGNRPYWNACAKGTGDVYLNAFTLSGGHQQNQFTLFTGGAERQRQQTGDASARSGGTTTGLFTRLETDAYCYSSSAPGCATDQATVGYWGGGAFSPVSPNAGRGTAYMLDSAATFWPTMVDNGTASYFTGDDQRKRYFFYLTNNVLNYWDFISHQDVGATTTNVLDNMWPATLPYMWGLGMEALIESSNIDKALDPTNTLGLADPRIPAAIQSMTDYVWTKTYDQTYATEGIHSYSQGYNPKDVQVLVGLNGVGGTSDPFFNELVNMTTPAFGWLYNFCGGGGTPCHLSDGTTYDVASDTMRMHGFDSYNCNKWKCSTYSDGKWLHSWSNGTGTPKQLGQSYKWGLDNDYQWRTGTWSPFTDDLAPANNPCWDSLTIPCSGTHPFADTEAPYMFQLKGTGFNYQDDPGDERHFTGDTYSPIFNITSTSAEVQFYTYESTSSSRLYYGTSSTSCNSQLSTEESGYPHQVSGLHSSIAVYVHRFLLSALQPATTYYVQLSTTDPSGNTATNGCAAQIFNGSGINFQTLTQTVLTITTTSLPNGSTTQSYNATLQAAGGNPPYIWSIVSGSLPPNLTLNASTGAITGTPSAPGTYSFTAQVADSATPPHTAQQPLSITVTNLQFTTTSLPAGISGTPYNTTLAVSGGTSPYTFSVVLGFLPTGLSLNTSTGAITGTPQACGNFPLTFKVQDSSTPPQTAVSKPLMLVISGCSPVQITTGVLTDAVQGVAYNALLTATGGTPPYTWSIISGALPTGLTLNASTGVISGTSNTLGTVSFTVKVVDQASNQATANLSITTVAQLAVTTTTLNNCTAGTACNDTVQATGGVTPYTWCIVETSGPCDNGSGGALPPGLTISTNNNNGIISGTTGTPGNYSFTVQVTDSTPTTAQVAQQQLSLTVVTTLVITTPALPNGTVGFSYNATLAATGGYPPYTWCVMETGSTCDDGSGGALPPGITLNANSGALTGAPTAPGIFTPTFRVQDSQGNRAQSQLGIVIGQPLVLHTSFQGSASLQGSGSLEVH